MLALLLDYGCLYIYGEFNAKMQGMRKVLKVHKIFKA